MFGLSVLTNEPTLPQNGTNPDSLLGNRYGTSSTYLQRNLSSS